jgi:hypothetical protein
LFLVSKGETIQDTWTKQIKQHNSFLTKLGLGVSSVDSSGWYRSGLEQAQSYTHQRVDAECSDVGHGVRSCTRSRQEPTVSADSLSVPKLKVATSMLVSTAKRAYTTTTSTPPLRKRQKETNESTTICNPDSVGASILIGAAAKQRSTTATYFGLRITSLPRI